MIDIKVDPIVEALKYVYLKPIRVQPQKFSIWIWSKKLKAEYNKLLSEVLFLELFDFHTPSRNKEDAWKEHLSSLSTYYVEITSEPKYFLRK